MHPCSWPSVRISVAGRRNDLTVGMAFSDGTTSFDSVVEVASLLENRATSRTGILADEFRTQVDSDLETWSLYFVDTFDVTERLSLTASGRYDNTRVRLTDRSGQTPELDGSHEFSRFNPALGVTLRLGPTATLYANVAQSARAPTPVELACASEDAPCNLPNAFLADPPLDEVVANSVELGAGGTLASGVRWHAGAYHIVNDDDILFQTTGGAQANVGFFENVGDTLRAGVELGPRTAGGSHSMVRELQLSSRRLSKMPSTSTARTIPRSRTMRNCGFRRAQTSRAFLAIS